MDRTHSHTTAVAHRRQRQIEDCLFEKLLHTPYASISVSDICREVGISRKAFYNYYQDKDACLVAIVDRVIHESVLLASTRIPDSATALEATSFLLDYWKEQKPLLDILIRNNLFHHLMMRFLHYVMQEDRSILERLNTPELPSDLDILACYTSIQLTLVLQWYNRDFADDTEEIAKKLLRVVFEPLIPPPAAEQIS